MPLPPSPRAKTDAGVKSERAGRSSSVGKPRHKKSRGRASQSEERALTWKEQVWQVVGILVVAVVVYFSSLASIGWIKEARKPFCDSGQPTSDDCIPCPENGVCYDGKLECLPGFKRQGKLCVSDKQIDQNAQKLAEFIQNKVCRIAGRALCDGVGNRWVTEEELWDPSMEAKMGLDAQKLSLAREKALDLVASDTLAIHTNLLEMREFLCPSEVAEYYKPFSCRIREWVVANFLGLSFYSFLVVMVAFPVLKFLRRKRQWARAEQLYLEVCEVLSQKATGSIEEAKWVVASRLRDHLLLPSERRLVTLWKQVETMVQQDSRIDQYPKMVKGESKIVWEWQVEGALHAPGPPSAPRGSGHNRVSFNVAKSKQSQAGGVFVSKQESIFGTTAS